MNKKKSDKGIVRPLTRQRLLGSASSPGISPITPKRRVKAYGTGSDEKLIPVVRPDTAPAGSETRSRNSKPSSRAGAFLTGLLDDDVSVLTEHESDEESVSEMSKLGLHLTPLEAQK